MQCTLLGRGWKISFRNHCQTPTRTVKRHCRGLQSERAIKEHISKNASTFRFWITFRLVQGAKILEGLVVTPSSISDGISWCLLCFSPVFVVYPSLKQIVDCGRLLLLLHWLHSNLPIAFRCPVNRIFQPYPPKAVAFSNIFQMFLPIPQNILGLSIHQKLLLFQIFPLFALICLRRRSFPSSPGQSQDRWPTFGEFPAFTAMSTFKNENKFIYTASTLQSKVTVFVSLEIIHYLVFSFEFQF